MKDNSIYVDQAKYVTSIVAKYLDTATVTKSTHFYKKNLPSDMIYIKSDASTSDDKVERLTREFNIHYRACIVSFMYWLSTRAYLSFTVYK